MHSNLYAFIISFLALALAQENCREVDEICDQELDLVFVLDVSGSIAAHDLDVMKNFVNGVVNTTVVGRDQVHIGAISYGNEEKVEFDLDTHFDKYDVQDAISGILHRGGNTNTKAGIDAARSIGGLRPGVDKLMFVVTDGVENIGFADNSADLAKAEGWTILSVGVSTEVDVQFLEGIASRPEDVGIETFFFAEAFDELVDLLDQVKVCEAVIACDSESSSESECIPEEICDQLLDLVIVFDDSGSMSEDDFETMKDFMKGMVENTIVGKSAVHVGAVKYSDDAVVEFDLSDFLSNRGVSDGIDAIAKEGGNTNIEGGIRQAMNIRGQRDNVHQVMVVLTDGVENRGNATSASLAAKRLGWELITVGIGSGVDANFLQEVATDDQYFPADDFGDLANVLDRIKVCRTIECAPEPDEPDCDDVCDQELDLMIVFDSSGSISDDDFVTMKDFINAIVENTIVARDSVHIGAVSFGNIADTAFHLDEFFNNDDVMAEIDLIQKSGGNTNIQDGIQKAMDVEGTRPGVDRRMIVLTDGVENRGQAEPTARNARDDGWDIYTVGIGGGVDKDFLRNIASQDSCFLVDGFDDLNSILEELKVCEAADCPDTPTSPVECGEVCDQELDLVIVFDSSGSISSFDYELMKEFMNGIVANTLVSSDGVHIGAIQYGNEAEPAFDLDAYFTNQEVMDHISTIPKRGGNTNIEDGIQHAMDIEGQRSNTDHLMIIMTDGVQNVGDAKSLAEEAKDDGWIIYTVGIGGVDEPFLTDIATGDNFFLADDFEHLNSLLEAIKVCVGNECESEDTICSAVLDFVWVMDHSGSISPTDFELLKDFESLFVTNQSPVGLDQVRYGSVGFADEPNLDFDLATFNSAEDVVDEIRDIRQMGGNTDIGRGLEFARNIEGVRGGSVEKVMFMTTDGVENRGDAEPVAVEVRRDGWRLICLGIGGSVDQQFLLDICTEAHFVGEFSELEGFFLDIFEC